MYNLLLLWGAKDWNPPTAGIGERDQAFARREIKVVVRALVKIRLSRYPCTRTNPIDSEPLNIDRKVRKNKVA